MWVNKWTEVFDFSKNWTGTGVPNHSIKAVFNNNQTFIASLGEM